MKKYLLIVSMLMSLSVRAYDFSAQAPSGQTLYFDIVEGGVEVVYPGTSTSTWGAYTMPSGALTIPASVTSGGVTYQVLKVAVKAFFNTDITSLTVEEGVVELAINSFGSCPQLASVTLPASLTAVGSSAFAHATALTDVHMQGSTPPSGMSVYAFQSTDLSACTLHLPCGGAAHYTDAPWSDFGTIDAGECSATVSLATADPLRGTVSGAGTYTVGTNVTLTATAVPPFRFACWSDGDTLNPRILNLLRDVSLVAVFQRPLRDTVTVTLRDTVVVRDTLSTHDTMVVFHLDTVRLVDTLYIHDRLVVHDTLLIRDSLILHDTLFRTDTVLLQPTFYRLQVVADNPAAGIGIGSALLPAGTEAEVGALPLEGCRFLGWDDGSTDNPRRITLTSATTLTALFERLGAGPVAGADWSLAVQGREVVVSSPEGLGVKVYDTQGRLVASRAALQGSVRMAMPAPGVYIVQVGASAGRRIVIQ